ncbi:MAG: hypothetical protein OK439_06510 [Thaumarchaeota archaeon]|nr:hypothetical protein [Nitrososphaerota archaeon]
MIIGLFASTMLLASNGIILSSAQSAPPIVLGQISATLLVNNSLSLEFNATNTLTPTVVVIQADLQNSSGYALQVLDSQPIFMLTNFTIQISFVTFELNPCSAYSVNVYAIETDTGRTVSEKQVVQEFIHCAFEGHTIVVIAPFSMSGCSTGCINATFYNQANYSISGIVFAVYHNVVGQPVYVGDARIEFATRNVSSTIIMAHISPGQYSVNLFVWNSGGFPVSQLYTVVITV